MDEEAQLEMQKQAAGTLDSESANSSPVLNKKKIRSMRHAATLANDPQEARSQNFDTT